MTNSYRYDGFFRKYNRDHARECVCFACTEDFYQHNAGQRCECSNCAVHRSYAFTKYVRERGEMEIRLAGGRNTPADPPQVERKSTVASANFCERHTCDTMAKSNTMGTLVIIPHNDKIVEGIYADTVRTTHQSVVRLELCPGCVGELMSWLDANVIGDRPRGYSKPWTPETAVAPNAVAEMLSKLDSQTLMRLAIEKSEKEAGLTDA